MIIDIEQQNDLYILHCQGRFVAGPDVEYVHSKMEEIQKLKCAGLLVDFRDVSAIGSIGVTFIVALYNSVVRDSGGRLVMVGVVPFVRQVLDLTGLGTIIPTASDIESGLAALYEPNASPLHGCAQSRPA